MPGMRCGFDMVGGECASGSSAPRLGMAVHAVTADIPFPPGTRRRDEHIETERFGAAACRADPVRSRSRPRTAAAAAAATAPGEPDPQQIRALHALFAAESEANMLRHPERATCVGDHRFVDRLDDASPAARAAGFESACQPTGPRRVDQVSARLREGTGAGRGAAGCWCSAMTRWRRPSNQACSSSRSRSLAPRSPLASSARRGPGGSASRVEAHRAARPRRSEAGAAFRCPRVAWRRTRPGRGAGAGAGGGPSNCFVDAPALAKPGRRGIGISPEG